MKRFYLLVSFLLIVGATFWLAGCSKDSATSPVTTKVAEQPLQGETQSTTGTSLLAQSVSISCYNLYSWTFTKSMDQSDNSICKDECRDLQVTITAVKGVLMAGFEGKICVQNTGAEATENLNITVTLLRSCDGGDFTPVVENLPLRYISNKPVLGPGESFCYYYEVYMSPFGGIDPNCLYKVVTNITITNYIDHLGQPFGTTMESPVIAGCAPSNNCVTVTDVPGAITPSTPGVSTAGWSVTPVPASIEFCESGTGYFMLHVCNNGVPTEESFTAENNIRINGLVRDWWIKGTLNTRYYLNTIGCTPPSGCTRTIGFYKTHAVPNLYGHNQDMVSAYLPINLGLPAGAKTLVVSSNTQVVTIMQFTGPGGASNGILKLYAQLLAAKLNIAGANGSGQGTSNSCIRLTIIAADAFLATHNANDWATMSKVQRALVLGAMTILDKYNNGLLCVSHCD